MTRPIHAMRTRLRRLASDDRGTSLAELLVGMAIMTVFMSIFLTSILLMTSTANKVEATSISATQTNQAFLTLDRSVRYASAISTPAIAGATSDWYIEFDSPSASNQANDTCAQLRIHAGQLQRRTWTVSSGTSAPASAWTPLASNVTNGAATAVSADAPFSLLSSPTYQRLRTTLIVTAGSSTPETTRAQMVFTALNSDVTQQTNATTCQQWGRP